MDPLYSFKRMDCSAQAWLLKVLQHVPLYATVEVANSLAALVASFIRA